MFEQKELPLTIFEYEKETIDYINNSNIDKMKENILGVWEVSAANVILDELVFSDENVSFENEAAMWEYIDEKRPEYGLGDEHVHSITLEKIDADTNAIIVELSDTDWVPISTYIGIAYNKAFGIKYFTLEKSLDFLGNGNQNYMFCHVEANSRGSYFLVENNKNAFIAAIKNICAPSESDVNTAVPDEGLLIDGIKCTLKATVTVMDFGSGGTAALGEGTLSLAGLSIYNDKGENITSKFYFGKIKLAKGKEIITGSIDKKSDAIDHAFNFVSKWSPGDFIDVTVEIKDSKGKLVESAQKRLRYGIYQKAYRICLVTV